MSDENLRKVFVGNVPFNCTQKEFETSFTNVKGFTKGEIVTKQNSTTCRGFGFVTLNTVDNAEELKIREDLFINNRQLRFTEYTNGKIKHKNVEYDKNKYIYVDNIPNGSNREYLEKVFNNYSLGRHYVSTDIDSGEQKNNGLIEVTDGLKYTELLSMGSIMDHNGNELELCRWKSKQYKKKENSVTKYDLFKAFTAGRNLGIIEGHRLAKKQN